jgi:hypothetical protein
MDFPDTVVVDTDSGPLSLECPSSLSTEFVPPLVLEGEQAFKDYLASRLQTPELPAQEEALTAFLADLRSQLLVALGFDQVEPPGSPINSVLKEELDRGDHFVEKRLLEVHPGMWIPLLVLRPKTPCEGLCPGILVHHGHDQPGKTRTEILTLGTNLARRGAVVAMPDWFGFGDLTGVPNKHVFAQGLVLAGRSMNVPITSVGRRVVDYLLQRADVAPQRIGAAGHSGGAETVLYLSAVDERIAATACIDGVADWDFMIDDGLPRDPEHYPLGLLAFSGYPTVLAASAPRQFFALSGDQDTVAVPSAVVAKVASEAAPAWTTLGFPTGLRHQGFPGGHQISLAKREAIYSFFAEALDAPGLAGAETGPTFKDSAELHLEVPGDSQTLVEFVRARLDEALAALVKPDRTLLRLVLGAPGPGEPELVLQDGGEASAVVSGLLQRSEGPDLPVDLYRPSGWSGHRGVLCLADPGRADCVGPGLVLSAIGFTVLAADLRSFGELEDDWPVDDDWKRERIANFALALGDPLPNMWMRDVADLQAALAETEALDRIGILGAGPRSGFIALLAGAVFPSLEPVVALAPYLQHREAYEGTPEPPMPFDLYPLGLFTATDLEGLSDLLQDRPHFQTEEWEGSEAQRLQVCRFFLSLWKK